MVYCRLKGVSPLVAAVLLISFTMAIAAILATWATNYMTQQTETFQQRSEQANCVYARLRADTYLFSSASKQLVIVVENTGKIALENFSINVFNSTGTFERITLSTDPRVANKVNTSLLPNEFRSFTINDIGNLTRFVIGTQCGEYAKIDQAV